MKNIYILMTDKPTWFHKSILTGILRKSSSCINDMKQAYGVNIHITNDEEIKKGDWCINPKNNKVMKVGHHGHHGYSSKKIILTTDADLIKDGIQSIDDEFLEWFVKNPSCEFVETLFHYPTICDEGDYSLNLGYWTIILPKEESKQETLEDKFQSWDELIKEVGGEKELLGILKLPHIAPLVREAMRSNCKNK